MTHTQHMHMHARFRGPFGAQALSILYTNMPNMYHINKNQQLSIREILFEYIDQNATRL